MEGRQGRWMPALCDEVFGEAELEINHFHPPNPVLGNIGHVARTTKLKSLVLFAELVKHFLTPV